MEVILDSLGQGDRIEIRDFGVFQIMERNAREARNPRTGVKVHVGAKRTVKFKTGKSLLERVRTAGFREATKRKATRTNKQSSSVAKK